MIRKRREEDLKMKPRRRRRKREREGKLRLKLHMMKRLLSGLLNICSSSKPISLKVVKCHASISTQETLT